MFIVYAHKFAAGFFLKKTSSKLVCKPLWGGQSRQKARRGKLFYPYTITILQKP